MLILVNEKNEAFQGFSETSIDFQKYDKEGNQITIFYNQEYALKEQHILSKCKIKTNILPLIDWIGNNK